MAEPKPLSFANVPTLPKPSKPTVVPGALSFPASAPVPPAAPKPPLVTALNFPQKQRLAPTPAAPAPVSRPLSFDNVVVPPKAAPAAPPKAVMSTSVSPIANDALKAFVAAHPVLFRQEELKITRQIQQLLPLRLEVVMDWGTKTMERLRDDTAEATLLMTAFANARGNDLIESTMNAITGKAPSGLLNKLKALTADPTNNEPALAVLQSQLTPWMQQCDQRITSAKAHQYDMTIKSATLAAVADSIDVITDNDIDRAVHQRRQILAQGAMNAELTVKQLEDQRRQIIDLKLRLDGLLNTTLPAYKQAKARR